MSSIRFGNPSGDTLVVLLHGCTWAPWQRGAQLRHVGDAIRDAMPGADLLMPVMPIEFWSVAEPDQVVTGTLAAIDHAWATRAESGTPYQRVLMVGFSFGSVLLRRLYCLAAGARGNATVDTNTARPWANKVERLVLLAGLNRGWTTESPVSRFESTLNCIGTAIGHLLPIKPAIFSIRRGAPFLTLMRLQWLALERLGMTPPLTVQLLGTRDDIVSPADNVDLATGERFVYIEVPQSGHFDVVNMGGGTAVALERRTLFQNALTGSRGALTSVAVTGAELLQLLPAEAGARGDLAMRRGAGASPSDVVFVVHGIRDKGY